MGLSETTAGSIDLANREIRMIAEDVFDMSMRRPAVFDVFASTDTLGDELMIEHQVIEALQPIRKWVGERQFKDVIFAVVRGYKETYEKSFEIDRKRAKSMTGQQIVARVSSWLGKPEVDFDKIVHDLAFIGGTGPTGYDGVSLWNASHPRGAAGAVQSNISTTAWSIAQHEAVVLAGAALTDVYGENLGIQYDTIVVGPALARQLRDFLNAQARVQALSAAGVEATASVVAATTGPSAKGLTIYDGNGYTLVIDPRFAVGSSLANKYLYLDSSKGVKPVAFYRGETDLTALTDPTDANMFNRDFMQWGIRHDIAVMAGAWQVAFYGNVA